MQDTLQAAEVLYVGKYTSVYRVYFSVALTLIITLGHHSDSSEEKSDA